MTLENIRQTYIDVPMGRKLDALNLILRAYEPRLCMIFCNTKLMVEEVTQYLSRNGFLAEALHGDLNQSQRTRVMDAFKSARIPLLVATDVAARGIDVNDIDYVINYDVPGHDEYYVHRIGRTGRAGKEGCAVTICSGRRQYYMIRDLARMAKSEIAEAPIPTVAEIRQKQRARQREALMEIIEGGVDAPYREMAEALIEAGCDAEIIAAAAMQAAWKKEELQLQDITFERRSADGGQYRRIVISLGRRNRIAPNHVVSAVAEKANIPGREIGKIEIYDDHCFVGVPAARAEQIVRALRGLKICGFPAAVRLYQEKNSPSSRNAPSARASARPRAGFQNERSAQPEGREMQPLQAAVRRGKIKLSEEARARLLDPDNLSRFEIAPEARPEQKREKADGRRREPSERRRDRREPQRRAGERTRNGKNNDRGSRRRDKRR